MIILTGYSIYNNIRTTPWGVNGVVRNDYTDSECFFADVIIV